MNSIACVASVLSIVACFLLGCIQSRIWNGIQTPTIPKLFAHVLLPNASPDGDSLREPPSDAYFVFGRMFIVVYVLLAVVLVSQPLDAQVSSFVPLAVSVLLGAAAFGNLLAYYASKAYGPPMRKIGYRMIEMPCLLILAFVLTGHGILLLTATTSDHHSTIEAWAFVLTPLFSILCTAMLRYMPHGPLLGISVALTVHAFTQEG
ncbi:Aste57867_9140 [Aphanomyces stellatus]|uniref:Aste57867_9140 protein n=1 Tax=Aphanomyces stellatus TaxID=120398 RepID=A0A485KM85_9STRA|nr:hypothetical protein As57867_009104 [Aphanomyces stellatus]VFT86024.1 Aste57867_9140 [Aphanomyces stellatus]